MMEAESSAAPRVVDDDQLCTPVGGRKKWWGTIIFLHKNHKALAAAGQPDAYCKLCDKVLRYNNNTGNLNDHVTALHKDALSALSGGPQLAVPPGQTQMQAYCKQVPHFELQLVRWVVQNHQSINVVEQPAFRDMIAAANSNVRIPSRRNINARLEKLEAAAREGIRKTLKGQHLAITADAWSSPVMDSFLSVTAAALDERFHSCPCL